MKNINSYKLNIQLFAEPAGSTATNQGEGQTPANSTAIDNGRIEQIVNSRADGIIKSVMKQHGLTGDELDAALKEYEAKEIDYKINSSLHKLANDEGVSLDKIPYLEKLISKEGLVDEEGNVKQDALKEQMNAVLKAFPDFKGSSNNQGEAGYQPIGGGGGTANNNYIGFEICEDDLTDKKYFNAVYKEAVELFAYLCKLYNWNPKGKNVIISNKEGYKLGIASNHGDIDYWLRNTIRV